MTIERAIGSGLCLPQFIPRETAGKPTVLPCVSSAGLPFQVDHRGVRLPIVRTHRLRFAGLASVDSTHQCTPMHETGLLEPTGRPSMGAALSETSVADDCRVHPPAPVSQALG